MERQIEKHADRYERQGNPEEQAALGLFHLLKLAAPFGAVGRFEQRRGLFLRLGHGAGQVAAAHTELNRDETVALLAVNRGRALADVTSFGIRAAAAVERRYQVAQPAPWRGGDVIHVD